MNISHTLFGVSAFALIAVPFIADYQHWGIPSEINPQIITQYHDCPTQQKNDLGLCPASHRGSSMNFSGGGFSSGK